MGILGFAVLLARAAHLQIYDAERLKHIAENQSRAVVRLEPPRGEILDRNGRRLAVSAPVESVEVSPEEIEDRRRTARELARALNRPAREIFERLARGSSPRWVRRWISPRAAERVRELDLPGIRLRQEHRRYYPNGSLAAAHIGFTGHDGKGLEGLELLFDRELSGRGATLPVLRDARGWRLLLSDPQIAVRSARSVRSTLDLGLTDHAARVLETAVRRYNARRGSLFAMDPRNGDVLALAEVPSFDPNRFWDQSPDRFLARVFVDAFEPGSTLKPFTVALALEAGVVQPHVEFDCEGGLWRVRNRLIRDYRPYDVLSVHDILRVSSNIGSAKIANRLGSMRLVDGMRRFGFGTPTGSLFPGEVEGIVRDVREAQAVERANLAFGQGLTVTAAQLAAAGSILANGGRMVTPRLRLDSPPPEPGKRVISEETARSVLEMMRAVVESGTGRAAALPHHAVAGKTGTAQKVVDGRYSNESYVASFMGIVPVSNPRLVMVVVLDEPQKIHTGGRVAAPVFREVANYAIEHLDPQPEGI
ncbi:MAG: penicillin-binding protein 2 [Proteobacteria bacterium]|nr:penicillin-binding protein 2 [Pseudomonadota bacterium]